ncbi:hypothetical protein [Paenibacillus oceani]|uniref:Uncharacterized protein n=1 Tax=Paenibacillus oceani TaxID=2772510 RepID=A0A927CG43_9BACL|nr:hypothetical protein [Paenibacillus oceani]MBD2866925.1 hypothetical protein [Paenibacillus oceani]
MKIKSVVLLILVGLFLGGCKDDQLSILEEEKKQWGLKEETYLKDIEELKKTNDLLSEKLNVIQTTPQLSLEQLLYEDVMDIYEKYPWLQVNRNEMILNKVTIGRYINDPKAITVTDPLILKNVPFLLLVEHRYFGGFPSGYQSEVGEYTYTLHTETDEHQVQVIGRGLIAIGEDRLKVSNGIHKLAEAFVKSENDYGNHIFTKIQNSGLMVGQKQHTYALFSEFRIKGVASVLSEGVFLKHKPVGEVDELLETITFYYQGEEIIMHLYPDYIHLIEGDKQHWLEMEKGGQTILSFLSAG